MSDVSNALSALSHAFEAVKILVAENEKLKTQLRQQRVGSLEDKDVEWVVNNLGELGVKIGNQFFFLYKGESLVYDTQDSEEPDYMYRKVNKREFGETNVAPDLVTKIDAAASHLDWRRAIDHPELIRTNKEQLSKWAAQFDWIKLPLPGEKVDQCIDVNGRETFKVGQRVIVCAYGTSLAKDTIGYVSEIEDVPSENIEFNPNIAMEDNETGVGHHQMVTVYFPSVDKEVTLSGAFLKTRILETFEIGQTVTVTREGSVKPIGAVGRVIAITAADEQESRRWCHSQILLVEFDSIIDSHVA